MNRPTMRQLNRVLGTKVGTGVGPLLPFLGPFLVSLVFILLYCGPSIPRGLACLSRSRLLLASGPSGGPEHRRGEAANAPRAHGLGERICRVVETACNQRPAWWSLDFWVDPEPHAAVLLKNRPSMGSQDGVARLLTEPGDPGRVDLAILEDGLVPGVALPGRGDRDVSRIQALIPLHRSVLCIFTRKGSPFARIDDLRGRKARVYIGPEGSGARILARRVLDHCSVEYQEVDSGRPIVEIARAMACDAEPSANQPIEVAFVLDRLGSAAIREFAEAGCFDLISVEESEELFSHYDLFRSSSTIRPVVLSRGMLLTPAERTEQEPT